MVRQSWASCSDLSLGSAPVAVLIEHDAPHGSYSGRTADPLDPPDPSGSAGSAILAIVVSPWGILQREALIDSRTIIRLAWTLACPLHFESRDRGAEVAAERLLGALLLPIVVTPQLVGVIELVDRDFPVGADHALLADERGDRRGEVPHLTNGVLGRGHAREAVVVLDGQTPQPVQRPVQDAGKLGLQLPHQAMVLFAKPRVRERQQHDPADDGGRCVTQRRQLVGYDVDARRQLSCPWVFVLAVDGQGVLAGDAEEPLHHDVTVFANKSRVRDDRERLADQRREAEIAAQAVQRRPGDVLGTDEGNEIRAITPLPPRVGPTINNILWRSSRPLIT
jgi:hypothetical protein